MSQRIFISYRFLLDTIGRSKKFFKKQFVKFVIPKTI